MIGRRAQSEEHGDWQTNPLLLTLWIGGADEALSYAVMREQVAPCGPCPD